MCCEPNHASPAHTKLGTVVASKTCAGGHAKPRVVDHKAIASGPMQADENAASAAERGGAGITSGNIMIHTHSHDTPHAAWPSSQTPAYEASAIPRLPITSNARPSCTTRAGGSRRRAAIMETRSDTSTNVAASTCPGVCVRCS